MNKYRVYFTLKNGDEYTSEEESPDNLSEHSNYIKTLIEDCELIDIVITKNRMVTARSSEIVSYVVDQI